jgi:hypothetical protein
MSLNSICSRSFCLGERLALIIFKLRLGSSPILEGKSHDNAYVFNTCHGYPEKGKARWRLRFVRSVNSVRD